MELLYTEDDLKAAFAEGEANSYERGYDIGYDVGFAFFQTLAGSP